MLRAELELALRRPRSHDELEAAVRSAAEETERLSRLAEDLLLIARADQGTVPLRSERIDLEELLGTVRDRFANRAALSGREIRVEGDSGAVSVDGDPLRLEQALGNLVDNSLVHGSGSITLSARTGDGSVELHVGDEGRGFSTPFLGRAFDRFSRADESRSTPGTGLGLAIVALIARAHGGEAHAENARSGRSRRVADAAAARSGRSTGFAETCAARVTRSSTGGSSASHPSS